MAKNIVIAEGGTAKSFTAKKIKTKLQGSGTCNWVPEDEAIDYVNIKDKTFTAKGTYKPSDFNCDAFGEITVDVPSNVKEKTLTKNGIFYAADDGCLGYSKVTVAVPEGGGGGPFTVRFFDDDRQTILKTEANVPYGGSASCTLLDGSVVGGQYFKGWNPLPSNVKGDMNCYPVRGDYVLDPNEIQDDWETICADGGAHYPLGSYKALIFTVPAWTYGDYEYEVRNGADIVDAKSAGLGTSLINVSLHMVKVAEGEDGTSSTWISTGGISMGGSCINSSGNGTSSFALSNNISSKKSDFDWGTSFARMFLNTQFFDSLPNCLKDTIKPVTKYFTGFAPEPIITTTVGVTFPQKSSIDKIWIPSAKEFKTFLSTKTQYSDTYIEYDGIDYTQVYMPTLNVDVTFRTSCRYLNDNTRPQCILAQTNNYMLTGGKTNAFFGFCL